MKPRLIFLAALLCAPFQLMGQTIGPPQLGDQSIELYHYPGAVFARLGTVPDRVGLDSRQIVPLSGSGVTTHTFLWSTTQNATINVDIGSSTDCVNWDSVAADQTVESDSYTFEGGFCAVSITIDTLSAGRTEISYVGNSSSEAGSTTATPSYVRVQDGDGTDLASVVSNGATVNNTTGTSLLSTSLNRGFDGTNWLTQSAYGASGSGQIVASSSTGGVTLNLLYGSDGTNWQPMYRANAAQATTGANLLGVGPLVFDGTNWVRWLAANAGFTGNSGSGIGHVMANVYNGTTVDAVRSGTPFSATGAAVTGTLAAANIVQFNASVPALTTGQVTIAQASSSGIPITTMAPDVNGVVALSSALTGTLGATVFNIKTGPGNLYGYELGNAHSAFCVVQIFNVPSSSVSLGTTVPVWQVWVPTINRAGEQSTMPIVTSTTGLSAASTTAAYPGSTTCTTATVASFSYK